jgi:hypothetical protein
MRGDEEVDEICETVIDIRPVPSQHEGLSSPEDSVPPIYGLTGATHQTHAQHAEQERADLSVCQKASSPPTRFKSCPPAPPAATDDPFGDSTLIASFPHSGDGLTRGTAEILRAEPGERPPEWSHSHAVFRLQMFPDGVRFWSRIRHNRSPADQSP